MKPGEGTDRDTLEDMLEACAEILESTQGTNVAKFLANRQRRRATAFSIAVLGEAVKRLTPEFRSRHTEIPWSKIAGMRDRLIHGYDTILWDLVWETATVEVPALLEQLRQIKARLD
jgi:uncharacterized protein with HEPN domain